MNAASNNVSPVAEYLTRQNKGVLACERAQVSSGDTALRLGWIKTWIQSQTEVFISSNYIALLKHNHRVTTSADPQQGIWVCSQPAEVQPLLAWSLICYLFDCTKNHRERPEFQCKWGCNNIKCHYVSLRHLLTGNWLMDGRILQPHRTTWGWSQYARVLLNWDVSPSGRPSFEVRPPALFPQMEPERLLCVCGLSVGSECLFATQW